VKVKVKYLRVTLADEGLTPIKGLTSNKGLVMKTCSNIKENLQDTLSVQQWTFNLITKILI
jgi:hypothetical protein